MGAKLARYQRTLLRLSKKSRQRTLTRSAGVNFTSNDYLALSNSPRIRHRIAAAINAGMAVGAGGSRLLRGNHDAFEALESEAAVFFKCQKTLFFSSGYAANVAVLATLPQRGDLIVYDERVHASMLDGIAKSRADQIQVEHNDIEKFADTISQWRLRGGVGHPWIVVESLYSMDGDRAPLQSLIELANAHDGFLVVDEAHATGVFGACGEGLVTKALHQDNVVVVHTCGKALGLAGAFVCVNEVFYHYLINCARPFIFSTAPPPLIAVGVSEALKIVAHEPEHRQQLALLSQFANHTMEEMLGMKGSGSQILPIIMGDNQRALHVAQCMQTSGFDVRAIRPPTVPEGSARLRITISLHVQQADIVQLFSQLAFVIGDGK